MYKIEVKGVITTNDTARVYHYFGWDCCCPKDISNALEKAGGQDVVVEVNSNGGICTAGFEMYNALKQYSGKVTVHVISAMSAATFIACAADETLISRMGIMMIHNTKAYAEGDYREMDKGSEMLRAFNDSAIAAYEEKTGMGREELQDFMDKETYMSPEKAVEYGFADGYIQSGKEQESSMESFVVVNAECPVISDEKAHEILQMIQDMENRPEADGGGVSVEEKQLNGDADIAGVPVSDRKNMAGDNSGKGEKVMTLEELYDEHPELKAEVDTLVNSAGQSAAEGERKRLQSLDALAESVSPEVLQDAKYGDETKRTDARELAYQALVEDGRKAGNYMAAAIEDSEDSGVEQVKPDVADKEEPVDESDTMAGFVNAKKRGGKADAAK